jgi:serine/threonine-protein phosphatase 6 catalytic subunit
MKLEEWAELTNNCKYLPEKDLRELCTLVSDILVEESNVQPVSTPVTVCGDIHGQYYDLMELLRVSKNPPETGFIFMGDFVDRGYYSIETLTKLLVMKVMYPDKITLLRGNHESRSISQVYGFYDECNLKYGNSNMWKMCCDVFDLLPTAALIDEEVLCVHGGLSPLVKTLDSMRVIVRDREVPQTGALSDLVWSDPSDSVEYWAPSPRGAGWLFGESIVRQFNRTNGLHMMCRSHQLVMEGYCFMFDRRLATVWSAPNYYYRCGNFASVFEFDTAHYFTPVIFEAVPNEMREIPSKERVLPYFV